MNKGRRKKPYFRTLVNLLLFILGDSLGLEFKTTPSIILVRPALLHHDRTPHLLQDHRPP